MEGGRVPPILSLDASSSWASMEIRIQERVGMHRQEDPGPQTPLSPTTSILPREDMSIYGSVPSTDPMQLVVCKWCGRAVKDTAMLRHQELHHPTAKNAPLLLDKITHPSHTSSRNALVKEQKAERKKKGSKGKDHYDPDRHCGVWLVDEKRNCLRSLTCKYHSLSLRRQVKDRSKPFDELLMLHKEQKKGKSLAQGVVSSQPTIQGAQPVSDSIQVSTLLDSAALPSCQVPPAFAELWVEESDMKRKDSTTAQPSTTTGSLSHSSTHPKPLACCKWRTRAAGGGHLLFNRQQDQLYTSLTKLATGNGEDSVSNSMTVAHRKHVFSLLHDEQEKRKSIVFSRNYQLNNFHVPPTNSNMELLLERSSRPTHNSKQSFDIRSPSASTSMGESRSFQFPFPKCTAEELHITEKRNSMVAPAKLPKTSKKRRRSSSEQNNSAAQSSSRSNSISVSPFDELRDMSQPFISLADIACQAAVTMVATMTTTNHQVQDNRFTFPTSVEQHPPVEMNKEDQTLPTTPEDFNSMISKMVQQQQQPQALPLPPPIVFNGMIAGTPGGLIAAMPPQPTAGTIPGNVLSLHSTTPTGLSPQVAQFNPGNMAVSPHQLFPGVIPQASYHESLVDKPPHSTPTLHQYLQDRFATGQMINFNNQHSSFFVPKQPTSYHPHSFNMLNTRRTDNSNANCNNYLQEEDSSSSSSSTCESMLEPLLQFAASYSSDDKQSELSLFDSKSNNLEQISDQQQVT